MNSTVTMILIKEKPLLRALWTPDLPGSPYTCGGAGSLQQTNARALGRVWLCDPMDCRLLRPWEVRTLEWLPFPPPGMFPTQGSNPRLLHCQVDSLPQSPWEAHKVEGLGASFCFALVFESWLFRFSQETKMPWSFLRCQASKAQALIWGWFLAVRTAVLTTDPRACLHPRV